jgi:hypothetical protein
MGRKKPIRQLTVHTGPVSCLAALGSDWLVSGSLTSVAAERSVPEYAQWFAANQDKQTASHFACDSLLPYDEE